MGLLDEYGLDVSDIEVPSWDIEDGVYDFVVGDVFIKAGSTNRPDQSWIIIEYLVGEDGKRFSELYGLPEDASNPTESERKTLGRYKGRLLSLGISPEQVNSVGRDELVGIAGTFQLRTTAGKKGGTFQNIRNLRLADTGSNEFAAKAATPAAAAAPKAKAAPAAKTTPPTVKDNPFAK